MMGDFKYACERGWGFFDGWTCQAPLVNNLILHVDENGKGPTIHVDLGEGASARLIPASGDSEVVAVGFDDRLLAAETNAGEWFYLIFGQRAAGQNWPNVVGPFSKVDLDAELFPEKVPRMRRTGATDD
ncbi:MAG: hypothetical protein ACKVS5_14060 [Parvularculaceae bacterium]